MKYCNLLSVFIIWLSISNCKSPAAQQQKKSPVPFIELRYVGVSERLVRPLLISDEEINIKVIGDSVEINYNKPQPLESEESLTIGNGYFVNSIIDSYSFQKTALFISHYSFGPSVNSNNTILGISYLIICNGKIYKLSYKQQKDFVSQWMLFLEKEKCSSKSVASIKYYFNHTTL